MKDDLSAYEQQEPILFNEKDTSELICLKEKLGVTEKEIREAIHTVGNDKRKIEIFLNGEIN